LDSATTAVFREFAQSRWPRLVRLGFGLTGDRGLAEDLAQTAITGTAGRSGNQPDFCFDALSAPEFCHLMPLPVARTKGAPVSFDATVGEVPMPLIGDVRSDVQFVTVSLSDGQPQ
jgi:hypothetical protein